MFKTVVGGIIICVFGALAGSNVTFWAISAKVQDHDTRLLTLEKSEVRQDASFDRLSGRVDHLIEGINNLIQQNSILLAQLKPKGS